MALCTKAKYLLASLEITLALVLLGCQSQIAEIWFSFRRHVSTVKEDGFYRRSCRTVWTIKFYLLMTADSRRFSHLQVSVNQQMNTNILVSYRQPKWFSNKSHHLRKASNVCRSLQKKIVFNRSAVNHKPFILRSDNTQVRSLLKFIGILWKEVSVIKW